MLHLFSDSYSMNAQSTHARASLVSFALDRLMHCTKKSTIDNDLRSFRNLPTTVAEIMDAKENLADKIVVLKGTLRFLKSDNWLTVDRGGSALHTEITYEFTDHSQTSLTVVDYHELRSCESLISSRDLALRSRIRDAVYQISGSLRYPKNAQANYLLLERYSLLDEPS